MFKLNSVLRPIAALAACTSLNQRQQSQTSCDGWNPKWDCQEPGSGVSRTIVLIRHGQYAKGNDDDQQMDL